MGQLRVLVEEHRDLLRYPILYITLPHNISDVSLVDWMDILSRRRNV